MAALQVSDPAPRLCGFTSTLRLHLTWEKGHGKAVLACVEEQSALCLDCWPETCEVSASSVKT